MIEPEKKPSVLVSFHYRKEWAKASRLDYWREVVLDSGAYSAAKDGTTINIDELAEWITAQRAQFPGVVTEAFTLDVIGGSWKESLRNTEYLWKKGVEVIPVYHVGEPAQLLLDLARDYPKVSLGGAVGYRKKMEWAALCFRDLWDRLGPTKVHGLGFGESATTLPFHTIDHSSWSLMPAGFGTYPSMGGARLTTKNTEKLWLYGEVTSQLRHEADARRRWSGKLPVEWGVVPSIRLAFNAYVKEVRSLSPRFIPTGTPIEAFPLIGDAT